MCRCPDLGRASDWLKNCFILSEALPRSGNWFVISMQLKHVGWCQYDIRKVYSRRGLQRVSLSFLTVVLRTRNFFHNLILKPSPPTEWPNLYQRHINSLRWINHLDITLMERLEDSREVRWVGYSRSHWDIRSKTLAWQLYPPKSIWRKSPVICFNFCCRLHLWVRFSASLWRSSWSSIAVTRQPVLWAR